MKLWDNFNKQWLQINSIFFDKDGNPTRITAHRPKACYNPIKDGWYDIDGDDLKQAAINDSIIYNPQLLPPTNEEESTGHSCRSRKKNRK